MYAFLTQVSFCSLHAFCHKYTLGAIDTITNKRWMSYSFKLDVIVCNRPIIHWKQTGKVKF